MDLVFAQIIFFHYTRYWVYIFFGLFLDHFGIKLKNMVINEDEASTYDIFELIWYGPDNPCRAKKNTNNFVIGNFIILTQLCDFVVVF
jgi:hypothetical protein